WAPHAPPEREKRRLSGQARCRARHLALPEQRSGAKPENAGGRPSVDAERLVAGLAGRLDGAYRLAQIGGARCALAGGFGQPGGGGFQIAGKALELFLALPEFVAGAAVFLA